MTVHFKVTVKSTHAIFIGSCVPIFGKAHIGSCAYIWHIGSCVPIFGNIRDSQLSCLCL